MNADDSVIGMPFSWLTRRLVDSARASSPSAKRSMKSDALGDARAAPRTLVEGGPGGADGRVDVGVGAEGGLAEELPGGGLDGPVGLGAARFDPFAVDEEPGAIELGARVGNGGHGGRSLRIVMAVTDHCHRKRGV